MDIMLWDRPLHDFLNFSRLIVMREIQNVMLHLKYLIVQFEVFTIIKKYMPSGQLFFNARKQLKNEDARAV